MTSTGEEVILKLPWEDIDAGPGISLDIGNNFVQQGRGDQLPS